LMMREQGQDKQKPENDQKQILGTLCR